MAYDVMVNLDDGLSSRVASKMPIAQLSGRRYLQGSKLLYITIKRSYTISHITEAT
jgi:hypothetical protein